MPFNDQSAKTERDDKIYTVSPTATTGLHISLIQQPWRPVLSKPIVTAAVYPYVQINFSQMLVMWLAHAYTHSGAMIILGIIRIFAAWVQPQTQQKFSCPKKFPVLRVWFLNGLGCSLQRVASPKHWESNIERHWSDLYLSMVLLMAWVAQDSCKTLFVSPVVMSVGQEACQQLVGW